MRKIVIALVAALALSFSGTVFAEDGINEIGKAFVAAMKAGDVDAVAALYAPDAVSYPPDAMVATGRDEIRESWGSLLNEFDVEEIELPGAQHETRDDFSAAWGRFEMTLVPKEGGDPVVMEGRFSDVAKRIDGKWQYLMDHSSMPLPPPPDAGEAQ